MSLGEFDYSVSVQGATMRQCPVAMASILQRTVLTSQDARKKTLELTLSWKEVYSGTENSQTAHMYICMWVSLLCICDLSKVHVKQL